MRGNIERVLDIAEAIARIEKYAVRGREAFESDELIQNWIVSHLQIIGEAARSFPEEFRAAYPEIPWIQIVGMRNILVHEYFGIDKEVVWSVVEKDLLTLKQHIEELRRKLAP